MLGQYDEASYLIEAEGESEKAPSPARCGLPRQRWGRLAGLKVLEMGQLIAGPFAAKTLADFGAEVIKIEPPGAGDPLRQWRLLHEGTSVWWQVQSRNKKSVALDLKSPEARDIVRRLIDECDVVVENFKPGVMEAWGFDHATLVAFEPRPDHAAHQRLRPDRPVQGPPRLRRGGRSDGRAAPPHRRAGPRAGARGRRASATRSRRCTA